ncbi:helix-turn-helix transcriptional regulator [Streptomyces sp. NPDC003011]
MNGEAESDGSGLGSDSARRRTQAAERARAESLRGHGLLRGGPVADAYACLLLAAQHLTEDDPERARHARVTAAAAAWAAGDRDGYLAALDPTAVPASSDADHCVQSGWRDYCAGMRSVMCGEFRTANTLLRPLIEALSVRQEARELLRAGTMALVLGDIQEARRSLGLALAAARLKDSLSLIPETLEYLAYAELREGRHHQARAHATEGLAVALRLGQRNVAAQLQAILALVASIAGDLGTVQTHARAALEVAHPHGLLHTITLAEWAQARAYLGCGKPEQAAARLAHLVRPGPRRGHFGLWILAVPCFVEAAVLAGHDPQAVDMTDTYALWADLGADPQAPALLARCRALLAPSDRSEELYRTALAHHEAVFGPFEHARTHLSYGMWLRRRRRPMEARQQLREALVGFERCGADIWVQQARSELRAAGEAVTPGQSGPLALLTPQQLRIARLVAEGATNREVASRLSLSIRTVDYHLRNVFAHLGVRSRLGLARLLAGEDAAGTTADQEFPESPTPP